MADTSEDYLVSFSEKARRFTQERNRMLVQLADEGATGDHLASLCGLSRAGVAKIIAKERERQPREQPITCTACGKETWNKKPVCDECEVA